MKAKVLRAWIKTDATACAYRTAMGTAYRSSIEDFLSSKHSNDLRGSVDLILTSPPFPLARPKSYGNLVGEDYLTWITRVFKELSGLLSDTGSLVVEIGNAWNKGHPTMSLVPLQTLIAIAAESDLHVCQQFVCHNPARLPSPVEWVNVRRIRVKDSFTHVWWFSKTEFPKADNRRVLDSYSKQMERLLKSGKYNSGTRPSGHQIGERSFLQDNGGAITSSVLTFAGTKQDPTYQEWCRESETEAHPARMQEALVEFMVNFLTDEGDLVLDPFAGSNTTGAVAERLNRRWLSVEKDHDYVYGSIGRFLGD